jgi:hypothetical protein
MMIDDDDDDGNGDGDNDEIHPTKATTEDDLNTCITC